MKRSKKTLFILTGLILLIAAAAVLAMTLPATQKEGGQDTPVTTEPEATNPYLLQEQAAMDMLASYLTEKAGHTGGTFLYIADDRTIIVTSSGVTGNYQSMDAAKTALFGSNAGDYFTKEVSTGLFLLLKTDDPYIHAVPKSQGVKNAIDRAYQLTDVEWTPVADMPGVAKVDGQYTVITYEAGVTYQGIPYSGTTATDTYVGLNVSLTSYLTALKNKDSVLYTENLFSTNNKAATYFGTVCSKFVQYALDIPGSYNSQNMVNIPGVKTIANAGKYSVGSIKLGDIVVDPKVHTTICTDILYDADGNIAYIEISEAVLPRLRRKLWTPDEFKTHFSTYKLCRYEDIDNVPAAPALLSGEETYALMPRLGDKYNYTVSEEKGIVDILESGYSKAVILRDGVKVSEISLDVAAKTFQFDRSIPGNLEMYLEKADGKRSGSVYACVVKSWVKATDYSKYATCNLTVSFEGSSGTPVYVQVGNKQALFCNIENAQDNQATLFFAINGYPLETTKIRVAYQNEYGIYLSDWTNIKTE